MAGRFQALAGASDGELVGENAQDCAEVGRDHAGQQPVESLKGRPYGRLRVAEEMGHQSGRQVSGRVEDGRAVGTERDAGEADHERHHHRLMFGLHAEVVAVGERAEREQQRRRANHLVEHRAPQRHPARRVGCEDGAC